MDLYILLAAGALGAVFLSSQDDRPFGTTLLKTLLGGFGGAMVYLILLGAGRFPMEVHIGSFLLLFVLGGFGGAAMVIGLAYLRQWFPGSKG